MTPEIPSIGEYGLIGDTRTAALVSKAGSIDWMCFPRFDSSPLFGRLVGGEAGGSFSVEVQDVRATHRRYRDGSALLETDVTTDEGDASFTEGFVADTSSSLLPQALVVRILSCTNGRIRARVRFDPKLDWRSPPERSERRHGRLVCTWGGIVASLVTEPDLALSPGKPEEVELTAGMRLVLALGLDDRSPAVLVSTARAGRALRETDSWWRGWSQRLVPPAEGVEEAVRRSLVTLRLLTYAPSGAPVAAPTTSLPEVPAGDKNWDYRYAWIRDASMGVSAFLGCGSTEEPNAFLWWMLHASRRTRPELRVLYDVMGGSRIEEVEVPGLPGYAGAVPVRIGNGAAGQFQLDAYAWMLDAGWAFLRETGGLYAETWRALCGHADLLAERWPEPDHGIWELRGTRRQFVHSKVMSWVGLDRALRIAARLGAAPARRRAWSEARDRIGQEVRRHGFDEGIGAYTQAYGSDELDAALLALPIAGIEQKDSPRLASTVRVIRTRLGAGGPLLYRFRPDGEGAFLPCSFWLVRALAEIGSVDEARDVFEQTCSLATDLGLFAEQIDPGSGDHLGNFPQAFTHSALVEASIALGEAERATERRTPRGSRRT